MSVSGEDSDYETTTITKPSMTKRSPIFDAFSDSDKDEEQEGVTNQASKEFDEELTKRGSMASLKYRQVDYSDSETDEDETATNDALKKFSAKEKQLMEMNNQLNKESEKVLKETSSIFKKQEELLKLKPAELANYMSSTTNEKRPSKSPSKRRSSIYSLKQSVQSVKTADEIFEDDEIDSAAKEMAPEAAVAFYKMRVKNLEAEMKNVLEELRLKDKAVNDLEAAKKEAVEELKNLKKQQSSVTSKTDKQRKEIDDLQNKLKSAQHENLNLKLEVEEFKKKEKNQAAAQQNAQNQVKDVRYFRVVEELEKVKTQMQDFKRDKKEDEEKFKKDFDRLLLENKQLEKQKQELHAAFKKQMKLIDILKRQKIHIEAARLLAFTEEEFMKAIDINSQK